MKLQRPIQGQDPDTAEKQLERDLQRAVHNLQTLINRAEELEDLNGFDRAFLAQLLYEAEIRMQKLRNEIRRDELGQIRSSWEAE